MNTIKVLGNTYSLDKSKDQILKRGLIDAYDLSKKINEWVVLSEYILWSARLQKAIVIPRWFVTDLASIPQMFQRYMIVNDRHRIASLPHDFGYCLAAFYGDMGVSRKDWDLVFRDFCKVLGVSSWKLWGMYAAVRTGGWVRYNSKSKEMFIPVEHRQWYAERVSYLDLPLEDGEFLVL